MSQSNFLTRDELDLTVIGAITLTVIRLYVVDGHLKGENKMRHSHERHKITFTFLHSIVTDRLTNVVPY